MSFEIVRPLLLLLSTYGQESMERGVARHGVQKLGSPCFESGCTHCLFLSNGLYVEQGRFVRCTACGIPGLTIRDKLG